MHKEPPARGNVAGGKPHLPALSQSLFPVREIEMYAMLEKLVSPSSETPRPQTLKINSKLITS